MPNQNNRIFQKMAAGFLGLVILSYLRFFIYQDISLDQKPLQWGHEVWIHIAYLSFAWFIAYHFIALLFHSNLEQLSPKNFLVATFFIHMLAALTLPLTSNDIFSNLAYGEMSHLHMDIYTQGAGSLPISDPFRSLVTPKWFSTPMVYGPIIEYLNRWIVVAGHPIPSMILFKTFSLITAFATILILYRYCVEFIPPSHQTKSFLFFAMNPLFIWEISSQAHNDGLMILGLVLFVFLLKKNFHWLAFLALLFSILTKYIALPLLFFHLCYLFRNFKNHFLGILLISLAAGLIYFPSLYARVSLFLIFSNVHVNPLILLNSISQLLFHALAITGSAVQSQACRLYNLGTMTLLSFLGLYLGYRTKTVEEVFRSTFICMALLILFVSPNYEPWHYLWLLPFSFQQENPKIHRFMAYFAMTSVAYYTVPVSIVGAGITTFIFWMFLKMILQKTKKGPEGPVLV